MSKVILEVNGWEYSGWQTVRVILGMEQIAGTFDLTVTDKWPGQESRWPILPGNECSVKIDDVTVITGYVDDVNPFYDKETHGIQISGRDRTGDLVDCSAIHKGGEWQNVPLKQLVTDLCKPFGIPVHMDVTPEGKFKKFALQESETAFEAIERACRQRAVLPISDGLGNLVITRAGNTKIDYPLIKGQNIEKADGRFSFKERFSRYVLKGQAASNPWESQPERHTQLKATSSDPAVLRYRPLCVIAEQGQHTTYKERAQWECNVRAGRSARVTYTVSGWQYPGGLWRPNRLVPIQDDWLSLDDDRFIVNVAFTLDEQTGSQTLLEVCRREAFDLVNFPDKKKRKEGEAPKW